MMASMLPDLQRPVEESAAVLVPAAIVEILFVHSFPDLRICSSIDESIFCLADRCYGLGKSWVVFRPTPEHLSWHTFFGCA